MQFIPSGPEIPEQLLQAHEEGRVVFFCGAGISYPAGLPGFKGLVDDIYSRVGATRTAIENEAYKRYQFDATLDLLERRLRDGRLSVRRAMAQALRPNLRRRGATDTHAALLRLARCRDGALRLVTTNFDHVFERAAKRASLPLRGYAAPMLPIPKNSRWDGLVYLHGVLPKEADDSALQRLVVTSGDFGLAYLTERWAARFVSELFRNYVVCFVGYSINDPVLRYMMDALAADRMLGEVTPQAYALGDCEPGQEPSKIVEWRAKGVTPILYEVPVGSHDHSALHRTLKIWSETHRDGVLGKERIVVELALARPSASTSQEDFVGRMLWALSDESGLPARRFAEFNPVPPLEWLEAFSERRYQHEDLGRFGVPPRAEVDDKLRFSFIHRPAAYRQAPWMTLVTAGASGARWDDVMLQMARWLARHLNDPALIIWLAERGGQLPERWLWLIEQKLDHCARLQQAGSSAELAEILSQAPNAIPGPLMRKLWGCLLAGTIKIPRPNLELFGWIKRFNRDGLTHALRLELRKLLTPQIELSKRSLWHPEEDSTGESRHIGQLADWRLMLVANDVHSAFDQVADERWLTALPEILDDLQQLLRDGLDLVRELGEADEHRDLSHFDLPSISTHWQNRHFNDWIMLIALLRDAWLAVQKKDPDRARRTALCWFDLPYPTFKRLALFAASQNDCIEPKRWVEWLVSDSAWCLWSSETQRETMRLMVLQGAKLPPRTRTSLEAVILEGPPWHRFQDDSDPEHRQQIVDHSIWLRLAKLRQGCGSIGRDASLRLSKLSAANPAWALSSDDQDEFPYWSSGTGDPDFDARHDVEAAPRKRADLVAWLSLAPPGGRPFYEDTWREVCRTRFFHSLLALCDLARREVWPVARWRDALNAWSDEGLVLRSWRFGAPLIKAMPEAVMQETAHAISWWIEAASKGADRHETIMLHLSARVMALPLQPSSGIRDNGKPINEPVSEALNHPVGKVTQAILNLWFKRKPQDNEGLPKDIELPITQLCDNGIERFRHGRVLLAANIIALFRADRSWVEKKLLGLFDWSESSVEARAAWDGFLWSPRLYPELMIAWKTQFLSTAHHYQELGKSGRQFAAFLTYAALEPIAGYTSEDCRAAIDALPQEGLEEVARALSQALESAGEKREDYWRNRILPFWQQCWPKSGDLVSISIAESLARMSIAAGEEFPAALEVVLSWLLPMEYPSYVVHRLNESGLCTRYPDSALRLLDAIVRDRSGTPSMLRQCLNAIALASSELLDDYRYKRLSEYGRKHGI